MKLALESLPFQVTSRETDDAAACVRSSAYTNPCVPATASTRSTATGSVSGSPERDPDPGSPPNNPNTTRPDPDGVTDGVELTTPDPERPCATTSTGDA